MSSSRPSSLLLLSIAGLSGAAGIVAGRYVAVREIRIRDDVRISAVTAKLAPPGAATVCTQKDEMLEQLSDNELQDPRLNSPATPAAEKRLIAAIEEFSGREPLHAIAFAARVSNLRIRSSLLRAALRGWGGADAASALAWAKSQSYLECSEAINFVLQGAVRDPEGARQLVEGMIAAEPSRVLEFGNAFVSALTEAGEFTRAVDFSRSGPAKGREDWMLVSFSRWAEFQPEKAAAAAARLNDESHHAIALNAVIAGWAPTDPAGLIAFSRSNFSPEEQKAALASALAYWAGSDPVAAATWINQNDPGPAADTGLAAIALSSPLRQKPEAAVNWATFIANPQLRADTLSAILQHWAESDSDAARAYVLRSAVLSAEDRSLIAAQFEGPTP